MFGEFNLTFVFGKILLNFCKISEKDAEKEDDESEK